MTVVIDLLPEHSLVLCTILQKFCPNYEVYVFGSRAQGTAHKKSDIDLCLKGDPRLSFHELAQLKDAFDEALLPMKVDVVQWVDLTPEFQRCIASTLVRICF